MRGPNEYTALRVSREDVVRLRRKMSLKHPSSRKTANLSNKARAFSIASLVHKGKLYISASSRLFVRSRLNDVLSAFQRNSQTEEKKAMT